MSTTHKVVIFFYLKVKMHKKDLSNMFYLPFLHNRY